MVHIENSYDSENMKIAFLILAQFMHPAKSEFKKTFKFYFNVIFISFFHGPVFPMTW